MPAFSFSFKEGLDKLVSPARAGVQALEIAEFRRAPE